MAWFRRKRASGNGDASEPGVASDLAEFLAEATEGRALTQAIENAHSQPDEPTGTAADSDVPPKAARDQ
jgi:hypothetical protein